MSIASLYPSINPSLLLDFANVKRLDPRITFTRTTTATYYDGVTTAKAEENLFTYSQEFDNAAWSKALVTITSNATTAPDGTSTADLAVANTTNGDHSVVQSFTFPAGTTLTISCYMKAAGYDYGVIRHYSDGNGDVWASFNLSTGAVDSNSSGVTASITSVGSSWYRCVMTKTYSSATSGNSYGIRVANAGGIGTPFAGNGTSGIYIWGAQLEQRSSVTAYTATTTQAITNYIPVLQTAAAGQARFDHNPTTGESLGLLIEEARTNLATYSESIGAWIPQTATVQDNQAVAPNGTLTAEKVIPSSTGANRGCYTSFTASGVTTISIYVKYGGYQWVRLLGPAAANSVWFDVLNGVKGTEGSGVTGTITAVGNGWYRISVTQSQTGTSYVQVNLASADNSTSVTVAANDVFSGVFLWGAQAETGGASFATSYIPNLSTGSTTRNADAASMTGTNFSSWFNAAEGTFFSDCTNFSLRGSGALSTILSVVNASNANEYGMGYVASTGAARGYTFTNGAYTSDINAGGSSPSRLAYGIKVNNYGLSQNGSSATTSTGAGVMASDMNRLIIGNDYVAGYELNGRIRKLAYYPIKATSAQLQALTV